LFFFIFYFIVARYTPQNISHDGQADSSPQLLVPVMIILVIIEVALKWADLDHAQTLNITTTTHRYHRTQPLARAHSTSLYSLVATKRDHGMSTTRLVGWLFPVQNSKKLYAHCWAFD
jgi:hypothetical protein